jgi:hypothetical protein
MLVALSVVENLAVAGTAAAIVLIPTIAWLLDRRTPEPKISVEIGSRFTFADDPDPVYLLALTARNHARRTATVVSWLVVLPDGRTVASPLLLGLARNPGLPATLAPRTEQTWYAPVAPIEQLLRSAGYPPGTPLRGVICLPDGVEIASSEPVSLDSLGVAASPRRIPRLPARVARAGFARA